VQCPYDLIGAVMALGEKHHSRVEEQSFTDSCTVHFRVRASMYPAFHNALDNLYGCQIKD
jgi:hypothetical protein